MDEIGTILPSLFRQEIRRAEPHLVDILLPVWPRIAGKTMAQHSQPAFFASGVLTLTTDCAMWGTQLRHMTEEIRTQINRFLGQSIVKKVRIKTVIQPSIFSSPRVSTGPPRPASPAVKLPIDTDAVADPEIAAALARSYAKYFDRPRR